MSSQRAPDWQTRSPSASVRTREKVRVRRSQRYSPSIRRILSMADMSTQMLPADIYEKYPVKITPSMRVQG